MIDRDTWKDLRKLAQEMWDKILELSRLEKRGKVDLNNITHNLLVWAKTIEELAGEDPLFLESIPASWCGPEPSKS